MRSTRFFVSKHLQQCCQVPQATVEARMEQPAARRRLISPVARSRSLSTTLRSMPALIVYDRDAAANCLNTVANINCGTISESAATSASYNLFRGHAGHPRHRHWRLRQLPLQCKAGEYCSLPGDGGTGIYERCSRRKGKACKDTVSPDRLHLPWYWKTGAILRAGMTAVDPRVSRVSPWAVRAAPPAPSVSRSSATLRSASSPSFSAILGVPGERARFSPAQPMLATPAMAATAVELMRAMAAAIRT